MFSTLHTNAGPKLSADLGPIRDMNINLHLECKHFVAFSSPKNDVFNEVISLKWGCALSDHLSELFVS